MGDELTPAKARTRAVFERIAPEYDAGPGCFAHFGARLVAAAGIAPGQRVLDVATGRGAVLLPAAELVGPDGLVIGIDLAGAMVAATREAATRRGLPAEVRVMDAEALDFPDASFDRVLCGFGVMFFPELARALGEFRRVLKPGGRLVLSTWRVAQADDLAAVMIALGLADAADELGPFRDPAAAARALADAGFADARVWGDEAIFRYADLDDYWRTARGTGLRRWLDQLRPEQAAQARELLLARLHDPGDADHLHAKATANLAVAVK